MGKQRIEKRLQYSDSEWRKHNRGESRFWHSTPGPNKMALSSRWIHMTVRCSVVVVMVALQVMMHHCHILKRLL